MIYQRIAVLVAFILTCQSVYSQPLPGIGEKPHSVLTAEDIENSAEGVLFQDDFYAADLNEDGNVSKDEFLQFLKKLKPEWTEDKLNAALARVNLNENGDIGKEEFDSFLFQERVRDIFNSYDEDNDGFISIDELTEFFKTHVGMTINVEVQMPEVDPDRDGKISFNEFYDLVTGDWE